MSAKEEKTQDDYDVEQQDNDQPIEGQNDVLADPAGEDENVTDPKIDQDDKEAIDTDNIIKERTRGAKPQEGYKEPGDEEGIPSDE